MGTQTFPMRDRQPCPSCGSNTPNRRGPEPRDAQPAPQRRRPPKQMALLLAKAAIAARTSSSDAPMQPPLLACATRTVHRWSALRWNAAPLFPSNQSLPRASVPLARFERPAHRTKSIPLAPPPSRSPHGYLLASPTPAPSLPTPRQTASPPRSYTPLHAAPGPEPSPDSPPPRSPPAPSLPCPAG